MDKKKIDQITNFWENCSADVAHIGLNKGIRVIKGIAPALIDILSIDHPRNDNILKGKTFIDYGTGGGFVGEYLLRCFEIAEYTGYDISKRSLANAEKMLRGKSYNYSLVHVENMEIVDFESVEKTDYFLCVAVIQHFPNEEYFYNFFESLNQIKTDRLILQIRYSENLIFKTEEEYKKITDILSACWCNFDILSGILTNFKRVKLSEVSERSKYQYGLYERTDVD